MNDCLDNLGVCGASCCKFLYFDFKFLTDNMIYYYQTHGCTVSHLPDRSWRVLVPSRCIQLTADNRCSLHGSAKKPFPCRDLDYKTKHKYQLTKGCLYGIEE